MAASVFDSPLYARLFATGEMGRLFSDSAAVRAMLLTEGALAKVQGELGVIPELSAAAIHRASLEVQIDPGSVAEATGQNGVPVPGIVAAFRDEMNAPEHAAYVHWGATSQDIIDTALMLRLRQALALAEADIKQVLADLEVAAEEHAHLPMVGRTYGQQATPTTWGAVIARFGTPLLECLESLNALRDQSLFVSLSGASGTSSALGGQASETRAALALALGLKDPRRCWHTDRGPILRIADWISRAMVPLGAMGQTLVGLTMSELGEVSLGRAGASSTMPQKHNPVAASALVALNTQVAGLRSSLHIAAQHQHQRDGSAWFAEWLVLPQICLSLAAALGHAQTLSSTITPQPMQMRATLDRNLGLIHAESLSFALAAIMPRPEAQAVTKKLCLEARDKRVPLQKLAQADYPQIDDNVFDPHTHLGEAPEEALAFAARAKSWRD